MEALAGSFQSAQGRAVNPLEGPQTSHLPSPSWDNRLLDPSQTLVVQALALGHAGRPRIPGPPSGDGIVRPFRKQLAGGSLPVGGEGLASWVGAESLTLEPGLALRPPQSCSQTQGFD